MLDLDITVLPSVPILEAVFDLRLHGIDDPNGVHRAYLEPNGMVSVISHSDDDTDR